MHQKINQRKYCSQETLRYGIFLLCVLIYVQLRVRVHQNICQLWYCSQKMSWYGSYLQNIEKYLCVCSSSKYSYNVLISQGAPKDKSTEVLFSEEVAVRHILIMCAYMFNSEYTKTCANGGIAPRRCRGTVLIFKI